MVSIGAVGGIREGDYTSWAKKWLWAPDVSLSYDSTAFYIDEENARIYLWWQSPSPASKYRFGVYKINDHSTVFESSSTAHYRPNNPYVTGAGNHSFYIGVCSEYSISRSHQTYILLLRQDWETMEVWRNGANLWSRKFSDDTPEASEEPYIYTISLTGRYILAYIDTSKKLILYEGA